MKRILFVDDESCILDGIRRLLRAERSRWEMHFASGGEEALKACEHLSFDVVVSDMRMPGMDGATLLGHVRDRYPGAARLILSGYAELAQAARASTVAYRSLAKPCAGNDLRDAIDRVCTLQDALCTVELRQLIGTIGDLPSLSETYVELAEAVRNPDIHVSKVAEIIGQDTAMSAKILQLTNSAFYGFGKRINNVHDAVAHLGMNTIQSLALVSDTFKVFAPDPRIFSTYFDDLQRHVQQAASIAAALPISSQDRDAAIIGALLHDIGELVLASKIPDRFCEAIRYADEHGCEQFEAEEAIIGISHAEIGAYLLGLWGIDHIVIEAIAHHHHPTRICHTGLDVSIVLYLADLLAHELDVQQGRPQFLELKDLHGVCLDRLKMLQELPEFRICAVDSLARSKA